MTTYLVTGGAGFIGLHLVRHLVTNGNRVRVLDNFSTGSSCRMQELTECHGSNIDVMEGDIRDRAICQKACRDVDYILHHAAIASVTKSFDAPGENVDVNITGTNNLLMSAVESGTVRRFVLASSCAVYGESPATIKRENGMLQPLSVYATTKLTGEYLCHNFFDLHRLPTIALRYFNVYGPGQDPNGPYAAVIPRFGAAILSGEKPVIYGDGRQTRDFVYISDIVEANMLACAAKAEKLTGQAFNIGSGQSTSLNRLLELFRELVGNEIRVHRQPPRIGDVRHSRASIDRARDILHFQPAVSIEDGLARTLEALRNSPVHNC